MATATTAAPTLDIDPKLVESIRKDHELAVTAYWAAVGHARAAGIRLTDVKVQIDRFNEGRPRKERIKFGQWVKTNCGFSRQTAWNYMTIADRWDELSRTGLSALTMRGALRYLKEQDGQAAEKPKKSRRRVRIRQDVWDATAKRFKMESDEMAKLVKALGIDPALV